ncbi:MAG: enoyl-CoA hydratase/isomerase family protein [Acidobacteriota bacterium]|nr:enoyl-CoA hydratase/isomerase family protein [Acidobacteriota bacterium]
MFVFKAAVVGAGTMGGQIAQTIAAAGIPVVLKDVDEGLVGAGLDEARRATRRQAGELVKKGRLDEEQAEQRLGEVLGRITGTTTYEHFGDVDFVVEAVPERMDVKRAVFAELDACTPSHAILASNTSSLSITEIGEATLRPDRVLGFHYFYPASLMPLIEIVEGDETALESVAAAVAFAQAIRKQPITCLEVPGFVVNRILTAGTSELWRAQEEQGLSIKAMDEGVGAAGVVPVGPYLLMNLLGLDTVLHVAEHLQAAYGPERFYVPGTMRKLVAEGKLGVKTGGDGAYDPHGEPNIPGEAAPDVERLVELLVLKTFAEACLVLEEGVAGHRDIDFGLMAGAGLDPRRGLMPPFMKADAEGLDAVLERFERAQDEHGARLAPPVILRRLVAEGRTGQAAGQGFYPYPRPVESLSAGTVKLELRADGVAIAWLSNGPMNAIAPEVIGDLAAVLDKVKQADPPIRALVVASANPMLFSAGADIRAFTSMDASAGERLIMETHALFGELEAGAVATVAAVNGLAYGGGCELAMACDVRLAARAATFAQPEIKLGIIPGFGGTQRLARLVGSARARELNMTGEPIMAEQALAYGLVNDVLDDHELFDAALAWARKLAAQAPLALGQVKRLASLGLDEGFASEREAFASVFGTADAAEGIAAFLDKRGADFRGA